MRLRTIVYITLLSVDQLQYSEFILSISDPSCIYISRVEELNGVAILELSPNLVLYIVDRLFGGKGSATDEARPITTIEQTIMKKIVEKAMENLSTAWQQVAPLTFILEGFESNPDVVQIAPPGETVITISLEIKIQDTSSLMNICFPYLILEDIISKLNVQHFISMSRKDVSDEQSEEDNPEEPYEGQEPEEPELHTGEPDEARDAEPATETLSEGRKINWLSIAAIALGAFGLFIGFSAKRSVSSLRTETEQVTSSKGRLAYLEDQIKSIERRLVNVGAETVHNKNQIRGVREQVVRTLDSISHEVLLSQNQVNTGTTRTERPSGGSITRERPDSTASYQREGVSAPPASGFHSIRPGDTFGKIARQYGVSVEAIFQANPKVDPCRLQIGQRIRIPEGSALFANG